MPYTLVLNVIVLNFSFYRDAVNNDSCTSTGIECEEIENSRNALTWGYSKKLPPNRKKSGKTLAKRPGRGIIAKPSDEGAPRKGAAPSRRAAREAGRGAGKRKLSQKKSLTRRGRESKLLSCANGGADSRPGPTGPGGNLQNRIL